MKRLENEAGRALNEYRHLRGRLIAPMLDKREERVLFWLVVGTLALTGILLAVAK
jgi:hypothetical protein